MRIDGPAGNLEAILEQASADRAPEVAVLCHPHPLYGGSMYDGVLDVVAAPLRQAGIDTLRFNFRGVGASDGQHDDGDGEVDDLLAVAGHARRELGYERVSIAGYSFGSRVAWRGAELAGAGRLILIAPPLPAMDFDPALKPNCPVLAIVGDRDNFADTRALGRWAEDCGAQLEIIAGADHFFGPMAGAVADSAAAWLAD